MKKSIQIMFILLILFMLLVPNFVQATGVNMNLTADSSMDNTTANEDADTVDEPDTNNDTSTDILTPTSTNNSSNSASVSSLNQLPEAGLGLNNIINIILIVIGILLILLGIAILIRLKQ